MFDFINLLFPNLLDHRIFLFFSFSGITPINILGYLYSFHTMHLGKANQCCCSSELAFVINGPYRSAFHSLAAWGDMPLSLLRSGKAGTSEENISHRLVHWCIRLRILSFCDMEVISLTEFRWSLLDFPWVITKNRYLLWGILFPLCLDKCSGLSQ